jgi:hypothetical protein
VRSAASISSVYGPLAGLDVPIGERCRTRAERVRGAGEPPVSRGLPHCLTSPVEELDQFSDQVTLVT